MGVIRGLGRIAGLGTLAVMLALALAESFHTSRVWIYRHVPIDSLTLLIATMVGLGLGMALVNVANVVELRHSWGGIRTMDRVARVVYVTACALLAGSYAYLAVWYWLGLTRPIR